MKVAAYITLPLLILVSCQKQTDCKTTIRCVDSTGAPVANAKISLYAPVKAGGTAATYTADVKADGSTDNGGEARFTFKLPAIFDVKATVAQGTKTLSGTGIVKLEEGKGTEKVITVK